MFSGIVEEMATVVAIKNDKECGLYAYMLVHKRTED